MPCGDGSHVLHRACAEDYMRRCRREIVGAVVVPCIYCRRRVNVSFLEAFRGADPRPVPARGLEGNDLAGVFWQDNEKLEMFVRRWAEDGLHEVDVLSHLG